MCKWTAIGIPVYKKQGHPRSNVKQQVTIFLKHPDPGCREFHTDRLFTSFFSWSPHVLQDVWARMLEDKDWFERVISKKLTLMAEHYAIISAFFDERKIYHFPMSVLRPHRFLSQGY